MERWRSWDSHGNEDERNEENELGRGDAFRAFGCTHRRIVEVLVDAGEQVDRSESRYPARRRRAIAERREAWRHRIGNRRILQQHDVAAKRATRRQAPDV